jgi:ubiquinone/menaquinone biosynthesis C-methylase UbiE
MTPQKNRVCPASASWTLDNLLRRFIHPPDTILGPYIRPGDRVLDIGCGTGFFTRAMARMVEENGLVIAVDIQDEMLEKLRERAGREGLLQRISTVKASRDSLNLTAVEKADFALAFYVVHEVPDKDRFFQEVGDALVPGAKLLVVEPKMHVTAEEFQATVILVKETGFRVVATPKILFSRAVLLEKADVLSFLYRDPGSPSRAPARTGSVP